MIAGCFAVGLHVRWRLWWHFLGGVYLRWWVSLRRLVGVLAGLMVLWFNFDWCMWFCYVWVAGLGVTF